MTNAEALAVIIKTNLEKLLTESSFFIREGNEVEVLLPEGDTLLVRVEEI